MAYVTQNACLPGGVRLGEWLDRVGGRKELQKELEERLGLSSYREKRIRTLSGGERQRAALAAALLKEQDVLLADEVTASQDEGSAAVMRTLLREAAQRGSLIILVTHDAKTAALCDRLYEYQGQQLREVRFPEAAKAVRASSAVCGRLSPSCPGGTDPLCMDRFRVELVERAGICAGCDIAAAADDLSCVWYR